MTKTHKAKAAAASSSTLKPEPVISTSVLQAWASTSSSEPEEAAPDLAKVAALAQRQLALEAEVKAAETALKLKSQQLFDVRCLELPEALSACGLSSFTLTTGERVEIKTEYYCSLTGQYREPALAWLKAQGLDSIVTEDVIASFGSDDRSKKKVLALLKALKAKRWNGVAAKVVENVNTSTFKALVREKLEAGEAVPVDEIGVTIQDAAKITPPKQKPIL